MSYQKMKGTIVLSCTTDQYICISYKNERYKLI